MKKIKEAHANLQTKPFKIFNYRKRQFSKFVEKKTLDEFSFEDDKTLKILKTNIAEFDCLKKTNICSYCSCPICKKTENKFEKYFQTYFILKN